jgi:hypothetical protein
MLSSVALLQILLPLPFVFLQLLDIPLLISTHSACLTCWDINYLWHYHTLYITSLVFKSSVMVRVYRSRFILQIYIYNCSRRYIYKITLGSNRLDVLGNCSLVLSSTTAIVHKWYNFPNKDIALIKLPINVTFTREYCHVMTKVKIVLLVLEQIKCFLCAAQNCICLSHPCD